MSEAEQVRPYLCIGWSGLPAYAARCIGQLLQDCPEWEIEVIASSSGLPIEGLDSLVGKKVNWIDRDKSLRWSDLNLPPPGLFFHTGWAYKAFNQLGFETRSPGGKTVCLIDNCWKGSLRQAIGAVYYRLLLRRKYFAVIVPGRSGQRLCRFLGQPSNRIFEGMNGADPDVFHRGKPLYQRPKRMIFAGNLTKLKGVVELAEAWRIFHKRNSDWFLDVYGQGPLKNFFSDLPGATCHGFIQSGQLAVELRNARILLLPSWMDHWGVVVHEAALSGCALICSNRVGAVPDLFGERNGLTFSARSVPQLINCLTTVSKWDSPRWTQAEEESLELSSRFGPRRFSRVIQEILSITRMENP